MPWRGCHLMAPFCGSAPRALLQPRGTAPRPDLGLALKSPHQSLDTSVRKEARPDDRIEFCLLRPRGLHCQSGGAFKRHGWLGRPPAPKSTVKIASMPQLACLQQIPRMASLSPRESSWA